jgi:hypothetical protein
VSRRRRGKPVDPVRSAAARKANARRRHEALLLRGGPGTEGKPRNLCACGSPLELTARVCDRKTRRGEYGLWCPKCEAFAVAA